MSKHIDIIKRSLDESGTYIIQRSRPTIIGRTKAEGEATSDTSDEMDITPPIPFVVSDQSVDEYGTAFLIRGWKLDMFNSSPIVTWGHPWLDSENPDDFIGLGPVEIKDSALIGMFTPEPGETNKKCLKAMNKLKHRVVKSASVYAIAYDGRMGDSSLGEDPQVWYFTDQELLAWGIVPFPGNTNCNVLRSKTTQINNNESDKAIAMINQIRAKASLLLNK